MRQGRDGTQDDQAPVIQIELWLNGSMPVGVATCSGGAARDFTGWVGLMSAVDALAAREGDAWREEYEG
jgi:hypothetical protein